MSDKPLPMGGAPLQVLVRGGTTSGAHDKERHVLRRLAEQGRAHQDRQKHAASLGVYRAGDGIASARLHSLRLMDGANPKLVLYYMNADGTVQQECVAEYLHIGVDEAFVMVCPRCLERGEAHGRAQMKIMKSHRKFHLDLRQAGKIVRLIDPDGKPFFVRLAGTVTVDDLVTCDSCNLFKVRIADSKVWRA